MSAVGSTRAATAALAAAHVLGAAAFLWPFLLPVAVGDRPRDGVALLLGLVLAASVGVLLFAQLGRGGLGPKTVALVGVLGAAMVALRLPGFVGGFSAMFLVVLVAGNAFGPAFGFVLGAVGTFASGLLVGGLGPWLPFQMAAVGWVGAGAGLVPRPAPWPRRIALLAVYGLVVGFAFGVVMNLWFWPFAARTGPAAWSAAAGTLGNLRRYARFYVITSLGWDAFRAVGNFVMVVVLGRPLLAALDRAARRMRLELRSTPALRTSPSAERVPVGLPT